MLGRHGLPRRSLLTIGGMSLLGWSLPQLLRQLESSEIRPRQDRGFGSAKSLLLVYLQGSPSHIDLWDPKPQAPADIRGEFKPISTRTPGLQLGEVLPKLAQQSDHYTIVRSIGVDPKGLRNHGAAIYMLMTGHNPTNFTPTGLAVAPSREDLPSLGANIARYQPAPRGSFSNVAVGAPVMEGRIVGVGQSAGLHGAAYDPYTLYDDATQPLAPAGFTLPPDMPLERIASRLDLRKVVDARYHQIENSNTTFDGFYDQAMALLQSRQALAAFHLHQEPVRLRERYGMTRFGQSLLLARRLIEADTRFVQVTWPGRSDEEPVPGPDGSWDTHRNNFPMLRDHRCPVLDHSLSALLEDLAQRGLLETTLVVAIGEFGRSPRIGAQTTNNVGPGGRDHWPECYSFLIAGGGVRGGRSYGRSDHHGAWPADDAMHPYDLLATLYHAIGINPATEYLDNLNRPRRLVESGNPVAGLF
ncbi:MAG TPA: DUF1501 domain-containing protein [Planctomycetaceae bacterium]|nr:DUF1501 domain-containing protein [Planctomycetaceae bacterium]|tara:strand:+ start:3502 stop:4917 length:1416 start_codon:yes stop_codon:yes gene_type:complete